MKLLLITTLFLFVGSVAAEGSCYTDGLGNTSCSNGSSSYTDGLGNTYFNDGTEAYTDGLGNTYYHGKAKPTRQKQQMINNGVKSHDRKR